MVNKAQVGVLALQGDFAEHIEMLSNFDVDVHKIKNKSQLEKLDGLIIPGGESTTIKKLIDRYDFENAIKEKINHGMSLWGTCAGLICIANKLTEKDPIPMGIIDVEVSRNWFGRQVDSFETNIEFKGITENIKAVFIRAPIVTKVKNNVEILSKLTDGTIVAVKQDKILGTSFHPEISGSSKVHEFFINLTSS
ncbi:MAG: pyridoxal 5'-phosphate synthase glutaminase subunit PdxT [Dehalococcoidales bacterium]|nr:pyridoxal 5'-phosphate synthase glutaminase subunit PdxT [Dehalococcoidia bacterium]NCG34481.1 pyridoxal 5'-phosphate synthase glutaminase subunit PdxT [Dehalococcoidales bacterium]